MNKKTIYIHIGMGKTGTTALQEFFWSNKNILDKNDICYPDVGAVSGAHHLLSPHIPPFLKDVWTFMDVDEWVRDLANVKQQKILLSSELMAWAKEDLVVSFCKSISEWFDPKIVIYLRRQDNLIMAGYNQQIKAGTQRRDIYAVLENQFARFDYGRILRPWASVLGSNNIIIRPYERQQFHCDDIRLDFMHHVFEVTVGEEYTVSHKNTNPRLSFAAMEYKRMLNNLIEDTVQSSQFNDLLLQYSAEVDESSSSIFSTQSILSSAERIEIIKRSESVNTMIANKYLGRKDGKLFYEDYPDITEVRAKQELPENEFSKISSYIQKKKPKLIKVIIGFLEQAHVSKPYLRRRAARLIENSIISTH